jgi:hypothetical protein
MPNTRALPLVGSNSVDRIFVKVVLPAPLAPRSATTWPVPISNETSDRAVTAFGPDP